MYRTRKSRCFRLTTVLYNEQQGVKAWILLMGSLFDSRVRLPLVVLSIPLLIPSNSTFSRHKSTVQHSLPVLPLPAPSRQRPLASCPTALVLYSAVYSSSRILSQSKTTKEFRNVFKYQFAAIFQSSNLFIAHSSFETYHFVSRTFCTVSYCYNSTGRLRVGVLHSCIRTDLWLEEESAHSTVQNDRVAFG